MSRHPLLRVVAALGLSPRRVALAVLTGAAALGSAVALIGVSAWLVARASQRPPVLDLSLAVVAVRALGLGRGTFRYLERLASHDVALRGLVTLRERCYSALAAAPPDRVARMTRGELLTRFGDDVDAVGDVLVRGLLPFAVAAVVGVGAVAGTALVLPVTGAVLAAALLLAGVLAPWLSARSARRALTGCEAARAAVAAESVALLEGMAELEVAGAVPARRTRLAGHERALRAGRDAAARPAALAAAVQVLATGAAVLAALLLGAAATAAGTLGEVWLPVVVLLPLAAAEAVTGLPAAAAELVRGTDAARRLVAVLDGPGAPARGTARPDENGPWALAADGVCAGWPGRPAALTGVDLCLPPGTVVAVTGASGSGKSTLLLTLAGLLAPRRGRVTLDGTDLADLDPAALRRAVHLTAEDAHVFGTTVAENLRVAAGAVTDDVLVDALQTAGLGPWLASLPAGLETVLAPGGTDLSGGERRRLLVARALLTGARTLLVDEPTEHLDPATADALVRDLVAACRRTGRSLVVVTHRLTGLDDVDEVLEVVGGRLVAQPSSAYVTAASTSIAAPSARSLSASGTGSASSASRPGTRLTS